MVQQAIDEWESRPSPNIEVVPAEQEWRLGYAPIGTVIDNLEVAAGLGYSNVVSVQKVLSSLSHRPIHSASLFSFFSPHHVKTG